MANGFFLGGLAQGLDRTADTINTSRAMGMKSSMFGQELEQKREAARQKLAMEQRKLLTDDIKQIERLVTEAVKAGGPEAGQRVFDSLKPVVAGLNRRMNGMNIAGNVEPRLQAIIAGGLTAEQAGARKGTEKVAEAKATGVPLQKSDLVTLEKDGRKITRRRDDATVDARLAEGWTEAKTPATAITFNEDKVREKFAPKVADLLVRSVDAANTAVGQERAYTAMAQLLGQGVQTGRVQEAVAGLQGVASDLGIDLTKIANVDLGKISEKEQFNRLARQVMIAGFEQFKGNLNQKEVEIAEEAFANLGTSEQANIEAVAAGLAAAQLARERGIEAASALANPDPARIERVLSRNLTSEDTARYREIRSRVAEDIRDQLAQQKEVAAEASPVQSLDDVEKQTREQLRLYIQNATDEELSNLPPDISDAIKRKLGR